MQCSSEGNALSNLFNKIFPEHISPTFFEEPSLIGTNSSSCRKIYPSKFELMTPEKLLKNLNKATYRFLMDTNAKLWFAEEGSPTPNRPAHFQMTGLTFDNAKCLAAGNLKFCKDGCILVTNKSGDFHPSPTSLVYFFAALYAANDAQLAEHLGIKDTIEIELWDMRKQSGAERGFLLWPEICAWFDKLDTSIQENLKTRYLPSTTECVRDYSGSLKQAVSSRRAFNSSIFERPSPYPRIDAPSHVSEKNSLDFPFLGRSGASSS